ncbi:14746_t:CDS:1, partial [Dentiscutata erythropus]
IISSGINILGSNKIDRLTFYSGIEDLVLYQRRDDGVSLGSGLL